ncbi:MAG TPA: hypothetical protein VHG35_06470 [Gemmatimonadales bacterium]|nr:hypothetical protein [Gemmatimonadales bacterium]
MRVVRNRLQPAGRVFYGVMQALLCAACLWMARVTWDAGRLAGSVDPGDPYVTVFRVQAAVFLAGAAATAPLRSSSPGARRSR